MQTIDLVQLKQYFDSQPIKKAWLFGSYADGTADENSDVDILVEFDYSYHIGLGFFDILWELEKLLHKKVDLVPIDALSKHIRPYVEQQKKLVYEKQ